MIFKKKIVKYPDKEIFNLSNIYPVLHLTPHLLNIIVTLLWEQKF